jgi:hypothetical protein
MEYQSLKFTVVIPVCEIENIKNHSFNVTLCQSSQCPPGSGNIGVTFSSF